MSGTKNLESVPALASKGWKLFPQHSGTKQPTIRKGWNTKATDSTKQLTEWWTASPDANIGVKTGKVSNIIVLDVDGDAGVRVAHKVRRQVWANPHNTHVEDWQRLSLLFQTPRPEVHNRT
jgi:hypothetical protein